MIQEGLFYGKLANCQNKIDQFVGLTLVQAKAQNQKFALTCLFSTLNAFQNGMTQPISTQQNRRDLFLVHGYIGGQAKAIWPQPEVL